MSVLNQCLTGKVALVTGASRGIGRAIALTLAAHGAMVIGTATTEAGAHQISAYFKEAGLNGRGFLLNVNAADSIQTLFDWLKEEQKSVNILVNNAAVTKDNLFMRLSEEAWFSVIETNLTAIYRLSKACIRDMVKARFGRIINIGSVVGSSGNPGQTNYAAAKAGILGFSKSLAQEVGSRNITVNTVAPGFITTDMTNALTEAQQQDILSRVPMQRGGTVQDVANAVLFLASPMADYITGQTLHVNGGMYMA